MKTAGLKLTPNKCKLFQKSVEYLGHMVSEEGVIMDPAKVEAVQQWPAPHSVKDIRSFLGLCSYYRKYIRGFSTIAACLNKLTGKNRPFLWTEECMEAFQTLKTALSSAPILAYPIVRLQFILDCDASNTGISGMLSQVQNEHERVIAFYMKGGIVSLDENY